MLQVECMSSAFREYKSSKVQPERVEERQNSHIILAKGPSFQITPILFFFFFSKHYKAAITQILVSTWKDQTVVFFDLINCDILQQQCENLAFKITCFQKQSLICLFPFCAIHFLEIKIFLEPYSKLTSSVSHWSKCFSCLEEGFHFGVPVNII